MMTELDFWNDDIDSRNIMVCKFLVGHGQKNFQPIRFRDSEKALS